MSPSTEKVSLKIPCSREEASLCSSRPSLLATGLVVRIIIGIVIFSPSAKESWLCKGLH